MKSQLSAMGTAFAAALRSFQNGGITANEFLAQLTRQLAGGAEPGELLALLQMRESAEPLPPDVHQAAINLLYRGIETARENANARGPAPTDTAIPAEAPTVVLEEDGTPPRAKSDWNSAASVGEVLGERFRLTELIGEGGMSRVFKAVDAQRAGDAPPIAIKVLTRPFNESEATFSALEHEVAQLRSLAHPNIVRLFDCIRDGSTIFITMEYLAGSSLYARLQGDVLHTPQPTGLERQHALSIIAAIADALDHAHRHQIIHGDLKPGNVIITDGGDIKVIDFGISSWTTRPKRTLDHPGKTPGQHAAAVTPRYASPQLMARRKPEAEDDVYALACLTYELLTGSHPFDNGHGEQTTKFPPPLRTGLTPAQYAAVVNALQFERRNRTPTIRQFVEEFNVPRRPPRWQTGAIWAMAAAFAVALGWFYSHRSSRTEVARAPIVQEVAPQPTQAPIAETSRIAKPGSVLQDCPACPPVAILPPGKFDQGSTAGSSFEKPQHRVVIGYPLGVSINDVTVADFGRFIAATGRSMGGCDIYDGHWRRQSKADWQNPGFAQGANYPVVCTSWNDAVAYAQWLSTESGHRYRLPSASEWEYAARAGSESVTPWSSEGHGACAYANVADQSAARRYPGWAVFACDDGFANTSPVGTFAANAFGLNDMLGNVFEWTQDCWHDDYVGAPTDGSPRGGRCSEHELRGGSWFSSPNYVRASYRNHFAAAYRTSSAGFRLVREIDQ